MTMKAKFDEDSWRRKVNALSPKIEDVVRYYAVEVKRMAQEQLEPIYTDRKSWPVSGRLRDDIDIDIEPKSQGDNHKAVVFNPVPYARRRHYENRAHPSTVGYFSKPLFKVRNPLRSSLKNLYKE